MGPCDGAGVLISTKPSTGGPSLKNSTSTGIHACGIVLPSNPGVTSMLKRAEDDVATSNETKTAKVHWRRNFTASVYRVAMGRATEKGIRATGVKTLVKGGASELPLGLLLALRRCFVGIAQADHLHAGQVFLSFVLHVFGAAYDIADAHGFVVDLLDAAANFGLVLDLFQEQLRIPAERGEGIVDFVPQRERKLIERGLPFCLDDLVVRLLHLTLDVLNLGAAVQHRGEMRVHHIGPLNVVGGAGFESFGGQLLVAEGNVEQIGRAHVAGLNLAKDFHAAGIG